MPPRNPAAPPSNSQASPTVLSSNSFSVGFRVFVSMLFSYFEGEQRLHKMFYALSLIGSTATPEPFCDVGRNRYGGPSHLHRQTVCFLLREPGRKAINCQYKLVRLTPYNQIAKTARGYSRKHSDSRLLTPPHIPQHHRKPSRIRVLFNRKRHVHAPAGRQFRRSFREIPCFESQRAALLAQQHTQVFSVPGRGRAGHFHFHGGEHRHGVAVAERREREQAGGAPLIDLGEFHHGIDRQFWLEVFRQQARRGVLVEALPELLYARWFQGHSGRVRMPAEAHEKIWHGFESFQQVEGRDAAPGALRQTVVRIPAQDENGTVQPLH